MLALSMPPCLALTEAVDGVARLTEARLRREVSEGKLLDFRRVDSGFEVIKLAAISKVKVTSPCPSCLAAALLSTVYCLCLVCPGQALPDGGHHSSTAVLEDSGPTHFHSYYSTLS